MIKLGTNNMAKAYVGSTEVSKMYLGSELVYSKGSEVLPYDAEVEYLEFTGSQYIELPIIPNEATDCIEIEFRRTNSSPLQRFFFEGPNGSDLSGIFQAYVNSSGRLAYHNGGWVAVSSNNYSTVGSVHHILKYDFANKIITYDFGTFTLNSANRTGQHNLILFGKYGSAPAFQGLVYSAKYWRNNEMIFDLQPVRKDNVGYMYDRIGGEMYGSNGIVAGYDKLTSLSDYTLLDYIQNTRTLATAPYIDTGISSRTGVINSTAIAMSMQVMYQDISTTKRQLMGSDYGPYFGCDKGLYNNAGDLTSTAPSTVSYDTIKTSDYIWTKNTMPQPQPLCIFKLYIGGNRQNTSTDYQNLCKIKAFNIYIDQIPVRNYVPVLHPSGVYGMFDKVENKFYASATSEGFTGGFDN